MSHYLRRRAELEDDPAALEAFLEERRQNARVWKQQQRERMEADPAYAERVRAARCAARERLLEKNPDLYREQRAKQLAKDPDLDRKKNARRKKTPSTPESRARNAEAQRRYRLNHPEKIRSDQMAHPQHEKRQALRARKEAAGCLRCPEKDGACLVFHHREPSLKSFTISKSVNLYSLEELMAEADKCDVLCHNCHAKEHESN